MPHNISTESKPDYTEVQPKQKDVFAQHRKCTGISRDNYVILLPLWPLGLKIAVLCSSLQSTGILSLIFTWNLLMERKSEQMSPLRDSGNGFKLTEGR